MPTVLITGGAKGIGLAVAERLLDDGWAVEIADLDREGGEGQAARPGVTYHEVDVTDAESLESCCAEIAARQGAIDAAVTCAGITTVGPSDRLDPADWRRILDVDLTGTFLTCRAAATRMPAGGAIVTLASVAALRGMPERAAYVAAKAGVVGLTKSLAAEWAERAIRVNSVAPGWVDTPFLRDAAERGFVDLDELRDRPPIRRLALPADIAGAIAFLLGAEAAFITGQTLYVDGGWSWAA
jgi:NAD(P)-dependent dehydrogenase (short-subunit alcohol dehydrogenase family)